MAAPVNHDSEQSTTEAASRRRRFGRGRGGTVQDDLAYLDDIAAHVDELQAELGPRSPESHDLDLRAAAASRPAVETANAQAAGVTPASSPTPEGTTVQTESQATTSTPPDAAPPQQHTFSASVADRESSGTQAHQVAIDTGRILTLLEQEAEAVRRRIDQELRNGQEEADRLVADAAREAERLREHGQQQARVLLREVEEIISESQRTAGEIVGSANEEAVEIREQAARTLAQAHEEARKIVETARRDGENILNEQRRLATVRAQEALREQDRLKEQIRRLEERRRQVLQSLEPLIDQLSQMIPGDRNVVQMPGTRSAQQQ